MDLNFTKEELAFRDEVRAFLAESLPQGMRHRVLEGMEVVDEIRSVKTGKLKGHSDVPVEPVFIKTARVIE